MGVVATAELGNNQPTTFDLTDLVKEWINGTNVASNGFMMKGVNENTVNKAFCSTEFGTTGMRPYMTLNYTPIIDVTSSITTVNVGSSITLTANVEPEDAIVTWSSGNNSIAIVSSTGVVTGVHAGSVTITATAGDASASVELLVTIPTGVYHIQNNHSKLYLACEMSWANTLDISQRGYFPLEPSSTRIMWRVRHLGNGLYSIRPLCNLYHGLSYSSSYGVRTDSIGITDSQQSTETAKWQIAYADTGYAIKYKGYNYRTLSLESDTNQVGANIVTQTQTEGLSRQQWSFTAVTREYNGAIVYDTDTGGIATEATKRYVSVGKTETIGELKVKATVYSSNSIEQDVYWTSSDPSIAQINSSTGQVTGVSPGTVTITARKANASGTGGIGTSDSYTVVVPELEDGTYYIRNRQHDKYVQACSALAPDYDTPGYALEQWELDGGTHQRWELELQYNGYYRIRCVISGLYMATQAGGEGTQDLFILQENEVINSPRQLWKIELTSHGSYKVKAKSSEPYSADLAMVAANMVNGSSNGIQVQQRLYVDNNSYKDEWYFDDAEFYMVHYYDESVTSENQIAYMTESTDLLNKIFFVNFGIRINMDGSPTLQEDALVHDCSKGFTAACDESCGADCSESHHKNTRRISDQLYNKERDRNHIYVLWSGHSNIVSCWEIEGEHVVSKALACVWNYRPIIQVMRVQFISLDYMSILLAHETAHTFGMPDVYENPGHDIDNSFECIMEEMEFHVVSDFYQAIIEGRESGLCDSCYQELKTHVANCFHEANTTD